MWLNCRETSKFLLPESRFMSTRPNAYGLFMHAIWQHSLGKETGKAWASVHLLVIGIYHEHLLGRQKMFLLSVLRFSHEDLIKHSSICKRHFLGLYVSSAEDMSTVPYDRSLNLDSRRL